MSEDQTNVNREKYIQAPLCLLAYPGNGCDDIVKGMFAIGMQRNRLYLSNLPEDELYLPGENDLPHDFDLNNREHRLLCAGAMMSGLRLRLTSMIIIEKDIRKYQAYIDDFESEFGSDALVRHKTALCFDVKDRGALNLREFAILSAIYSCLGQSSYRRITSAEIQFRATGCRSKEIFDTFKKRPKSYSIKQVRKTVEDLFLNGFFGRFTYRYRETYYSHKLSEDELREKVIEKRTSLMRKKKSIKDKDAAINKRLMKLKMG